MCTGHAPQNRQAVWSSGTAHTLTYVVHIATTVPILVILTNHAAIRICSFLRVCVLVNVYEVPVFKSRMYDVAVDCSPGTDHMYVVNIAAVVPYGNANGSSVAGDRIVH